MIECKKEFKQQKFIQFNERPVELSFLFGKISELYPKKILDVGTGDTALPHLIRNCGALVTATDNIWDYWPAGMFNRHYYIVNDDIRNTQLKDTFDLITCISVLEHIEHPDKAVRNMFSLLSPGGHLIITCPYSENEYIRNVYELPGSSYGRDFAFITQSFSRAELEQWLLENEAVILDQEYWQFWSGRHWTVGTQIIPPKKVTAKDTHQLTCIMMAKTSKS